MSIEGAIFDVDGVLLDSPHEKAWRESLRRLMEGEWADIRPLTSWTPDAFTTEVYQEFLSGKPRLEGARSALEHFGVPGVDRRAEEYGEQKQAMIEELIAAGDFRSYPDALRYLVAIKDAGLRIAAASSSKNAPGLMRMIDMGQFASSTGLTSPSISQGTTLYDLLDVDVSGRDFAHGKPAPDIYLAAAAELGYDPGVCVVTEDAPAGVEAAKAGKMFAVGISRRDDVDLLAEAGADLVVTSLDDVDVEALTKGTLKTLST